MGTKLRINLNAPIALLAAREYGGSALGDVCNFEVGALPHVVDCSTFAGLLLLMFSH